MKNLYLAVLFIVGVILTSAYTPVSVHVSSPHVYSHSEPSEHVSTSSHETGESESHAAEPEYVAVLNHDTMENAENVTVCQSGNNKTIFYPCNDYFWPRCWYIHNYNTNVITTTNTVVSIHEVNGGLNGIGVICILFSCIVLLLAFFAIATGKV